MMNNLNPLKVNNSHAHSRLNKAAGYKILIIGNEYTGNAQAISCLAQTSYKTKVVNSSTEGMRCLGLKHFDMILLSATLPQEDGFEILKAIRHVYNIPILFTLTNNDEFDCIYALELGADDVVYSPFSIRELLARIKLRIKRHQQTEGYGVHPLVTVKQFSLDVNKRCIHIKDRRLSLTDTEFDILAFLIINKGCTVSKEDISQRVFKRPLAEYDRSIDVHISNLRRKIPDCINADCIRTVRGRGYMLV
ncbi:response regulator transcription factor [Glaciecola petra]|uniref:Response regulator transcription factor n=1 Tax=Glaciecola petra TaxID=3075602 RepID=A0ABU2ZUQ0_9ALTE|nr:response regulator transcription factor [Aestuariibacter sp. P117]MDT0596368.1 response regulator transcription factor [Aestuariibacter sp. P117]